jgi:REP element-mobilizing transposase RayT
MKHRKPNRLKGYDYSQDNLYFVTSCVHDMVCCFGVVTDRDLSIDDSNTGTGHDLSIDDSDTGTGRDLSLREPQMILNAYGKIAEQQWYWLAEQYRYIVLHEFIVMPNHMHGIIEINRNAVGSGRDLSGNANDDQVGTGRDLSLRKIKSLSELMGAYKTTVSKHIHLAGYAEFAWQRSFHDHIIRDEKSYERISNYIIDNPKTWDKDKFFNVGTGRDLSLPNSK